jgi:predicted permease
VKGQEPAPGENIPVVSTRTVSVDFFETMGIPILKGRSFAETDNGRTLVAIVDEALAARYWPHEDPIGKQIRRGDLSTDQPWLTVVGVARGVKHSGLDRETGYYLYTPLGQQPQRALYVIARSAVAPESLTPAIRSQVWALDPQLPVFEVHTMEDGIARTLRTRRLTNAVLSGFAVAALLLAAIGIYGITALNVSSRTHEFGIRVALGAQPRRVVRMVTREGMILSGIGIMAGLAGYYWTSRFLQTLLFQIEPSDPVSAAVAIMVLSGAAFIACYLPSRRALGVDPVVALRKE